MSTPIGVFASQGHYLHHLAPAYLALPEPDRGAVVVASGPAEDAALRYGLSPTRDRRALERHVLVAGGKDAHAVPFMDGRRIAHLDHGAGQGYGGDPTHPVDSYGYPGGPDLDRISLFLTASPGVASRWRSRYPSAEAIPVGPCSLPSSDAWAPPADGAVALTFHWPCTLVPECGSAWRDWHSRIADLAYALPAIGHWHPRWGDRLRASYEAMGIEAVEWWPDVVARASVLVADNSSVMYEWAAMGRPVVALNARRWRPEVDHGLRFWRHVPGPDFWPGPLLDSDELVSIIDTARRSPGSWGWAGAGLLASFAAYGGLADGRAPGRAAEALLAWSAA